MKEECKVLDTHGRKFIQPALNCTGQFLLKKGLTANQVTWIAFIIGISSGVAVYFERPIEALFLLWFSGYLDAVDGTMARMTKTSSFGTVLDVSFDRLVEASVIIGLAFRYPETMWAMLLLVVSILFGMTVFLTVGTVSQNKGIKSFHYATGLAERTEGFILLSIMAVVPSSYLIYATILFIIIEVFTTLQRLFEAKKLLD